MDSYTLDSINWPVTVKSGYDSYENDTYQSDLYVEQYDRDRFKTRLTTWMYICNSFHVEKLINVVDRNNKQWVIEITASDFSITQLTPNRWLLRIIAGTF